MSFFETPIRRACFIRAGGLFVLATIIGAWSLTPDVDDEGRIICYIIGGVCAVMGLVNLWWARRTPIGETVTVIVDRAAHSEQARHFRRMLWLSAVAFPVMTAWIAYDLHQLENDIVSEVTIWAPIAAVYNHFGYWPAVLITPLVGILCCTVFLFKLTKLTAQDDSEISM